MVRYSSRGILCIFVVCGRERSGQERDWSGTFGSERRDPATLCSRGWAAQGTTRTHATHLDTLCLCRPVSIPLSLVSCLSCISCLLCELFCFCLASVLSLVFFSVCPSLCPSLCVCLYVCPCLSTVRPKWLLSPDFLREGAPDIQIFKKSINSEKSNRIVIQNNHDYNYKDD